MQVDQIMTREVWTCRQEDSLANAAQLMWEHDCGSLPVLGGDGATRICGLITDRDICMCALFHGKPLHELQVSEAMSKQVRACKPGDSITDAKKAMSEARIRRLPVLDEKASLVGTISLADIARKATRKAGHGEPELTETEVGSTLAAICQPGARSLQTSFAGDPHERATDRRQK